jgi:hypothetical protein
MDAKTLEFKPISMFKRVLLIILGSISAGLALLFVFIRGIPTTPFLLIATACYARSSERLYKWLYSNKFLKKPLQTMHDVMEGRGMALKTKIIIVAIAWTSITLAAILINNLAVRIILVTLALIKGFVMFFVIKTAR